MNKHKTPRKGLYITGLIAAIFLLSGWGPVRDTYEYEKGADVVTFNSATNNPNYGDERNFLNVKEADTPTNTVWGDSIVVENGKEYIIRLYVHNNASSGLTAKNVCVSVDLPTHEGKTMQVDAYLAADNAEPQKIWDQIAFNSDSFFALEYVPGSTLYTNDNFPNGIVLPDEIINDGVFLGFDEIDGRIPGGNEYTGWVSFRVRAITADFAISTTVRLGKGIDRTFKESVQVTKNDIVDFQIYFKNTGGRVIDDVVIKNELPSYLQYIPSTTKIYTDQGIKNVADGITTVGLNIGNYAPGGDAYLVFSAKVIDDVESMELSLYNTATAITKIGSKSDSAICVVGASVFSVALERLNSYPVALDVVFVVIGLLFSNGADNETARKGALLRKTNRTFLIIFLLLWFIMWACYLFNRSIMFITIVCVTIVYLVICLIIKKGPTGTTIIGIAKKLAAKAKELVAKAKELVAKAKELLAKMKKRKSK